jgi:Stress responsive A/B Barrel Domain
MKTIGLAVALVLSLVSGVVAADSATAKKGKLHHVVALKFKEGTSKEQIKEVETAFRDLKKKIKEVSSLKWGTNVSPEKHDKGFTHCFVLTFKSDKDRDAYLVHPDHKAFGKLLGPIMADVFVVDFWPEK